MSNYNGDNGIFPARTKDEQAIILGRFLPTGKHLRSKAILGKTLFKLLRAFGVGFQRLEDKLNEVVNGRILTDSTAMLPLWERLAGIPDDNYQELGDADIRQVYAIAKLSADGVSLYSELEWICSIFGYTVRAIPGHYFWDNSAGSRVVFSSEKESRFTIVFEINYDQSIVETDAFTYTFPIIFGQNRKEIMKRFILTIIDANVNDVWISTRRGVIKDLIDDPNVLKDDVDEPYALKDSLS